MSLEKVPLILKLSSSGLPISWINYEQADYYYSKNLVAWELGDSYYRLMGGTQRTTGNRSFLDIKTIIAVKGNMTKYKKFEFTPPVTSKTLFQRDHQICAYCGRWFSQTKLTKDHVLPKSKGGKDNWENLVSSCKLCNKEKADRTPEQANMELLYVPYAPNYFEHLILQNKNILIDQMDFLLTNVPKDSRIRTNIHEYLSKVHKCDF